MRIALSGKMTSGKSLVARYLVKNYVFRELAFAARLKEITLELFGTAAKDTRHRLILQQLAHTMREIDPYVWVRYLLKYIPEAGNVVVSDVRYPNEFETLKRAGFTMVRMFVSPEQQRHMISRVYPGLPLVLLEDYSETALDGHVFDYTINNDAEVPLPQVYTQVDSMVQVLSYIKGGDAR